jgi:hypothetical protein
MSEKRANRVLGIVVAALAAVALIVVLASRQSTTQLDEGSPEAAVQQYLQAVSDRNFDQALEFLSEDSKCTVEDFDRAYIQESLRIGLAESSANQETAVVTVSIQSSNGDPFGGTYTEERNFRLVNADGEWKITGTPWPNYECGMEFK